MHIRKTEWVGDKEGCSWFNSYYDNHGKQAEGIFENGIRMMLTGQGIFHYVRHSHQ